MIKDKGASAFANLYIRDGSGRREEEKNTISGVTNTHRSELVLEEEEKRSSEMERELIILVLYLLGAMVSAFVVGFFLGIYYERSKRK